MKTRLLLYALGCALVCIVIETIVLYMVSTYATITLEIR